MKTSSTKLQERGQIHDPSVHTYSIYIAPLPTDMTEKDLRFIFSLCGPIKRAIVMKKPFYQGGYFGYVHFQTPDAREKAKKYFDGAMLGKRCIQVTNDKFNEVSAKKNDEDWDNETLYEDVQRFTSIPKKRVHINESFKEINQSLTEDSFKQKSFSTQSKQNKFSSSHMSSRSKDRNQRKDQRKDQKGYERKDQIKGERKNERKDQRQDSSSERSKERLKGKKQSNQKKDSLKQTDQIEY